MLELKKQAATFTNLNCRVEKHDDSNVGAADLSFRFDAPNTILDAFAPHLRESLYRPADTGEAPQGELIEGAALPKLRYTEMSPFKWEKDVLGGQLTMHYGVDDSSSAVLAVTKVTDIKLHPKDGGTVTIQMKAQCRPEAEDLRTLWHLMVLEDVEISFEPPRPEAQQQDLGEDLGE